MIYTYLGVPVPATLTDALKPTEWGIYEFRNLTNLRAPNSYSYSYLFSYSKRISIHDYENEYEYEPVSEALRQVRVS
jgi:hypothetical protein